MSIKSRAREQASRPDTAPPPFFNIKINLSGFMPSKYVDKDSGALTRLTYKYVPCNGKGEKVPLDEYLKNNSLETPYFWALGAF